MSQERDDSRGRPAWSAEILARGSMHEVKPLPILELSAVGKVYRDPMTLRPFTAVEVTLIPSFSTTKGRSLSMI